MPLVTRHMKKLGLSVCESTAGLKLAYRQEIRKWHPDLHQSNPAILEEATNRSKEINAAFEHLSEMLEQGLTPRLSTQKARGDQTSHSRPEYRTQHTYENKKYTTGFPDPTVLEIFVKSSNIISIGYNRSTLTLYIKFGDNSVYSYFNVPDTVFSEFIDAESHGKYAHKNIYHKYKSMRYG